jgi:hypothetical protein
METRPAFVTLALTESAASEGHTDAENILHIGTTSADSGRGVVVENRLETGEHGLGQTGLQVCGGGQVVVAQVVKGRVVRQVVDELDTLDQLPVKVVACLEG